MGAVTASGAVPAAADGTAFLLDAPLLVTGPCGARSLDKPFTAPPFFLLEMVLLEGDFVFFFLGLLSLEGDTGVRLWGDRRTAVIPRPLADPAEAEVAIVP